MKRLYIIVFIFITVASAKAQTNLSWAVRFGNTGNDVIQSMVTDASGNIYVAGSFEGTVDFDPGAGVQNKTSAGLKDAFIAKYNASNTYQWVITFGNTGNDEIYSMDDDGTFLYVTGYFNGTVDFDPSGSVSNLTAVGGSDVFVGYYGMLSGNKGTVNSMGSTGEDYGADISVITLPNNDEEVYVTGAFNNTIDLNPAAAVASHTSRGGYDAFVAKYDNILSYVWSNSVGSTAADGGRTILISGSTVIAGGTYAGAFNYDATTPATTISNSGGIDGFIQLFNSTTGAWTYVTAQRSTGDDNVTALYSDGTTLWVGGSFSATATLGGLNSTSLTKTAAGGTDIYIGKYTMSNMNLVSFNSIGGTTNEFVNEFISDGTNLYVGGGFNGTADMDPGAGTVNLISSGSSDAFVARYLLTTGAYVSAYKSGGTGNDQATSLAFQTDGLITAGVFENTVDFDPNATTVNLVSAGLWDSAIAKYTTPGGAAEPTASPTAFVSSGVTGSGFSVNFTPATVAPTGYLILFKAGSAVSTGPTDGVVYTGFDTPVNDAKFFYSWTGPPTSSVSWSSAAANTTYHFAVYAFNGSGTNINYRLISPATGSLTTTNQATTPTGAPGNFQVTNATGNSLSISYTTGAGASSFVVFASDDGTVETTASNGIVYTAGNDIDDDRVVYVGSALSFTDTGLSTSTQYTYKIYSANGTGTAIRYFLTPLTGTGTTTASTDFTGPSINDNSPTSVEPGKTVTITASITDPSGIDEVYVQFYSINSLADGYEAMQLGSGSTYSYVIPASFNTEAGVEYIIFATDNAGNHSSTNNEKFKQIVVSHIGNGLTIPYSSPGNATTNYRLISIPLELEKKSVKDVFGDDLGDYDKSKYRLFTYNGTTHSELSNTSSVELGKGYWLISTTAPTIDTGAGKTKETGEGKPTTVPVTKGWNLIGNPFNFDYPWTNVKNHADNTAIGLGDLKVFSGAWSNSASFVKMTGAYVMVQNAGSARFPLWVSADRVIPQVQFTQSLSADTWRVNLTAKSGSFENTFAGFGMHPAAQEQNDQFDDFTLPRFMDYLEVNFNKKFTGSAFTSDVIPTAPRHVWEFDVESNVDSENIDLSWSNAFPSSEGLELVLWDVEQQRAINMKTESHYAFARGQSHSFRIYFGDAAFVKAETLPNRAVFHNAFPVPSAGNVNFAFSVPETGGKTATSLYIYDLMGHKVGTIVNEPLAGGYHEAVWNIEEGAKPAAGLYISVLKFGDLAVQKRLVIK